MVVLDIVVIVVCEEVEDRWLVVLESVEEVVEEVVNEELLVCVDVETNVVVVEELLEVDVVVVVVDWPRKEIPRSLFPVSGMRVEEFCAYGTLTRVPPVVVTKAYESSRAKSISFAVFLDAEEIALTVSPLYS